MELERRRVALLKAEIEADVPEDVRARREQQELELAEDRARGEHRKAELELGSFLETREAELAVLAERPTTSSSPSTTATISPATSRRGRPASSRAGSSGRRAAACPST